MSTTKKRPNVIVFFTDQQRHDSTGVHGNPMGLTPNFDRMARTGTHCHNAFTCQPVCLPARLALQTGRYPSQFGTYSNAGRLPDDALTLGHHFQGAGYTTGYVGKWHLCHENPVPSKCRTGYDHWLGAEVVELDTDDYDAWLYDNDGVRKKMPGYRADAYADSVIRFIDDHQEAPFFLMASWLEPHFQNTRDDYPAPEGYEDAYASNYWIPPDLQALGGTSARHLPGYYGMIKRLDECLGRIRDALRSLDLLDDTIIVFTTDHACHFKTRNGEYKRSCHDSSIRIPMAFSGPGFDEGGQLQNMISLIDVPPTLLDACEIPVPSEMQGRSIMPLVHGDRDAKAAWPEEVLVEFCNHPHIGRAVRTKRWTYSVSRTEKGVNPDDGWTFSEEFLYDLKADPWQLNNLIGRSSHKRVAVVMRERLLKRMAETGEPTPEIELANWASGGGQSSLSDRDVYA